MSDPLDHATGIEKRELLAKQAGNDNPFDMKVLKRGPGTKDQPNLIPSAFDARIVGCICKLILHIFLIIPSTFYFTLILGEEEQTYVNWMWLYQGHPKRCECGHWFKLVEKAPL